MKNVIYHMQLQEFEKIEDPRRKQRGVRSRGFIFTKPIKMCFIN